VTYKQGCRKCKSPRKLIEISRGPQDEDDRLFRMSQNEFFSWKRCTQE